MNRSTLAGRCIPLRPLRAGAAGCLHALGLCALLTLSACGGGDTTTDDVLSDQGRASAHRADQPTAGKTPDWAPGEASAAEPPSPSTVRRAVQPGPAMRELWGPEGRALETLPEDWPADTAARWSGRRYATRAQLDHERTVAAPYTLVIDADDEAAVESGLQAAEAAHAFGGGKAQMGVFVRSRVPALAARLAERLTLEGGWSWVFVVI